MSTSDGTFTLTNVPTGATISFSFIGYETEKVTVNSPKTVEAIRLVPAENSMREITVVGYGKQERRDITGSVSSVKLDEQKSFLSVDQLLQGRAPGVFVSNSSGALGGANLLA